MESIVFDMDDTLIPSTLLYSLSLNSCQSLDMNLFQKARNEVKGLISQSSTQRHSRLLYFKKYLELKNDFTASKLFRLFHEYEGWLKQHLKEWLSKHPERTELLLELKARKFKLFIATNENLYTQLSKLSILDPNGQIFDGMLTSEEVGFEKSDEQFHKNLIAKFNLVPSKSFFVGDDVLNDIDLPKKIGFKTIWVTEFSTEVNRSFNNTANYTIGSLTELEGIL